MATRAERARYLQERSKPPRKPAERKRRENAGTKRARGAADNTQREHKGEKGDRKAMVALEESLSGQPSRKSTRGSSNRQRTGAMLEYVARMKSATPQAMSLKRSRRPR